jgi:hypothetical protein
MSNIEESSFLIGESYAGLYSRMDTGQYHGREFSTPLKTATGKR